MDEVMTRLKLIIAQLTEQVQAALSSAEAGQALAAVVGANYARPMRWRRPATVPVPTRSAMKTALGGLFCAVKNRTRRAVFGARDVLLFPAEYAESRLCQIVTWWRTTAIWRC